MRSSECWNFCLIAYNYSGIDFIQKHPPPTLTNPRDTTWRKQKLSPRHNHSVQKPSPQDRTGSQKPHSRDIRLENFANISRTSNTIWNEKLCGLTNKMVFQWESEYVFGSHHSQTTERIKAKYDMSKCMFIIFWEKEDWNSTKKYFEFLSIPSKFFYS